MNQEKANILLVDDQPSRLLSYEAILERLDQNLVRAESGEDALCKLGEADFAAILLDVSMPGLDGFETARRIREHQRAAGTPIIFVTGVHVTDFDRLRGYEMGAADYVYVPVVPEILRGKVQVLVQLHRQRLELSRLNAELMTANRELEQAHERLKAEKRRELEELNRSLEITNAHLRTEVEERRRAEELLKDAARRKDEFISILAHELRNPLSAIQSGVELLNLPNLPEEKNAWARQLLQQQLRHLCRLIDDLLDVSRITTGRVQLKREALELKAVLLQSLDATRPFIEERGHEIELQLPDEPLYVDGDPVRLTQVFGNLLTNAAKYMKQGGRIMVSIEKTRSESALVRVRDCGTGLQPEMLERIFELFTRAEVAATRAEAGLGIGLALVRGLVELHGGTVRAASDGPGRGSEFTVELPLSESPAVVVRPPAPPETVQRAIPALRVLIIDDNVDAAEGLTMYFEANSEHELRVAETGALGVTMATEFEPDVVLLDIGLPDLDGYEVARRLRSMPCLKSVRLVAVTGFGADSDRKRAREAGFDRFLVKPVTYSTLEHVLADCVAPA